MFVLDLDTAPSDLIFTLKVTPMHGRIMKKEFRQDPPGRATVVRQDGKFSYEVRKLPQIM